MLRIAREFGQAPEDVEKWDPWWLNRTLEWLDGEAIAENQEQAERERRKK